MSRCTHCGRRAHVQVLPLCPGSLDYDVLDTLASLGESTAAALREDTGASKVAVWRALGRLEAAGLAERGGGEPGKWSGVVRTWEVTDEGLIALAGAA